MVLEYSNVLGNNSTTFERSSINPMKVHSSFIWNEELIDLSLLHAVFQNINEKSASHTLFTNFTITNPDVHSNLTDSFLSEDFDFYIPLKPKASFKVKAHIKSVKKFTPKPFFD